MKKYERKITIKNFFDLGKIFFFWLLFSSWEIVKIIFRNSLVTSIFLAAMFLYKIADLENDWTVWARLYVSIGFFVVWLCTKNKFKSERN